MLSKSILELPPLPPYSSILTMSSTASVVPSSADTSPSNTGFDEDTVFKILDANIRLLGSNLGMISYTIITFTPIGTI